MASTGPWATLDRCVVNVLAACKTLGIPSKQSSQLWSFASLQKATNAGFYKLQDVYDSAGSPLVAKIPSVKVYWHRAAG